MCLCVCVRECFVHVHVRMAAYFYQLKFMGMWKRSQRRRPRCSPSSAYQLLGEATARTSLSSPAPFFVYCKCRSPRAAHTQSAIKVNVIISLRQVSPVMRLSDFAFTVHSFRFIKSHFIGVERAKKQKEPRHEPRTKAHMKCCQWLHTSHTSVDYADGQMLYWKKRYAHTHTHIEHV